ncbi:hypothetical protein AUR64_14900 [Haloprofundus marisrubri]|uniref:DUF7974 domain-containing protein n=1 Tax=Haloprofundus marisrubri TaxID=1514971 RepID=A0A0W1R7A4_9EURY|nr:hypothetical protein [Haloprofundus marisrubri]KTG09084.1 hypothetical protein AUR64_14900 [Haloprofundus marisrubri]
MPGRTPTASDPESRYGFDESGSSIAQRLAQFVPQSLARRGLSVRLSVDRTRYERGEPVEFTITIRNRLPVPVTIATPKRRLWGWTIDGLLEGSDETRYMSDNPGTFAFRGKETKVVERTWNGRLKHVGDRTTWELPERGTHELAAFVATGDGRLRDTVEITLE